MITDSGLLFWATLYIYTGFSIKMTTLWLTMTSHTNRKS